MKTIIKSIFLGKKHNIVIDLEELTSNDLNVIYVIKEELINCDFWYDVLDYIYDQFPITPKGRYEESFGTEIHEFMCNYLKNNKENFISEVLQYDTDNLLVNQSNINMFDIVYDSYTQFDEGTMCQISNIFEKCFIEYIEKSEWNIVRNETETPFIWFGLKDKVASTPWIISKDIFDLDFWIFKESSHFEEEIIPDQSLLIWYSYECGNYFPDIETILETCPIIISKNDTKESIDKKLKELI